MTLHGEVRCATCGGQLAAALTLCAYCGTVLPEHSEEPRVLVLRSGPNDPGSQRRAEQLLANTGEELDGEEVRRQLGNLPALFRLPVSDAAIARLVAELGAQGFVAEIHARLPEPIGLGEYLESLWAKKGRLIPYATLVVPSIVAATHGAPFTATLLGAGTWLWWFIDRRRFLQRLTLEPERLSRRLDLVPEEILRPVGVLLRGDLTDLLRQSVSGMLVQHAGLLDELRRIGSAYPELVVPMREALTELTSNAVRLAEKAAAIERGGEVSDPGAAARLERVRAMRSEEIEERLMAMDVAQEARQQRADWLRHIHAILLVRLEATSDALRSLRQRALEAHVVGAGHRAGDAELDGLLEAVRRELQVVVSSVGEIERFGSRLAAARRPVAEPVGRL